MKITKAPVTSLKQLNYNTYLISIEVDPEEIKCLPGQFFNIKVSENDYPLLRRPFSVCDYKNGELFFLFNIQGLGTKILSSKKVGDSLDILGPLGNHFNTEDDYQNALIVAGGIGVAPFPFLTGRFSPGKNIITFLGGRTKDDLITFGLKNVKTATDDGSDGFQGNVVDLLQSEIVNLRQGKSKVFACGPTPMLVAIQKFVKQYNFPCEISTESVMACGFGICQGCPTKATDHEGYYLICKDGPIFDSRKVFL